MDLGKLVPGRDGSLPDWDHVEQVFPLVAALRDTPHDPIHHAEGCPLVHTRMVCAAMADSEGYRALPDGDRLVAFLAAILHDVAKPVTADVDEAGRVQHPGHSRVGATMARAMLWRHGCDPVIRERVCATIGSHQVPFWLFERDWAAMRRFLVGSSLTCGNDVLWVQALADARGRIAPDRERMIENIELFRLAAAEAGCLENPFPVPDGVTLCAFMASPETIDPSYPLPRSPSRPVATVMSGLPGSGKSTWLSLNLPDVPVISLDEIRDRMKIAPERPQGVVVAAAKNEAKNYLRKGVDFAWDATNLTRDVRGSVLGLCRDYGYGTRLVVTEAAAPEITARFRSRGRGISPSVFERMLRRWDHPMPWEADEILAPGFAHRMPSGPPEPSFTMV